MVVFTVQFFLTTILEKPHDFFYNGSEYIMVWTRYFSSNDGQRVWRDSAAYSYIEGWKEQTFKVNE